MLEFMELPIASGKIFMLFKRMVGIYYALEDLTLQGNFNGYVLRQEFEIFSSYNCFLRRYLSYKRMYKQNTRQTSG